MRKRGTERGEANLDELTSIRSVPRLRTGASAFNSSPSLAGGSPCWHCGLKNRSDLTTLASLQPIRYLTNNDLQIPFALEDGLMRSLAAIGLGIVLLSLSHAEPVKEPAKEPVPDQLPRIPGRSPEESAKLFEIHPGFRIEIAAAEPLVQSPVAAEFDEDGRLFVVELPEYNQYGSNKPHGKGRVVMLEDTDGDGKFDKRTVVVDGLDYPTAVFPWNGGLYVGAAPNLLYCKGNDRKKVLVGFGKDPAGEGQINSFRWRPEGYIHISTGLDGGDVKHFEREQMPVSVRSQNILFDPITKEFETTSGGGQHGMTLDDWGNTFVCGNSAPCNFLAYDTRYLPKNPALLAPPPAVNIAPGGKFTKLHRISEVEPWRVLRTKLRKGGVIPGYDEGGQPSGFFTGASGITIYRGDAYPPEFRGNAFVGEVANNLVFRARLVPQGTSFVAERADAEREFLASKDIWFRPVQFINGPDGCLYVIDMYRELIEGAAFLAPPVLKHVDPSAGVDKGRIWRIAPKDFKQPKPPKLSSASTGDLVKLLEHPNGWMRDTASRLLYQRQDKEAVEPLRALLKESKSPLGRLHAIYGLFRMGEAGGLGATDLLRLLQDPEPNLRCHALRILERKNIVPADPELIHLSKDPDIRVRCQLAWSLRAAETEAVGLLLQEIIKRDSADPWSRLAVAYSGTGNSNARQLLDFIADPQLRKTPEGKKFIETVVETAGASENQENARSALRGISLLREEDVGFQFHLLGVLIRRISNENMRYLQRNATLTAFFEQIRERALELACDPKADTAERTSAIQAMAILPFEKVKELFDTALKPNQPQQVQVAALQLLGRVAADETPQLLLKIWPTLSPAVRATAAEVFLSRPGWVQAFLDAVENKKIGRGDVDPARIALLKKSPSRAVRLRVEELFKGTGPGQRKDVIDQYQKALALQGDSVKGKAIFKKECSACHRLDGVGEEVGADLKAIRDRGTESMLINILDPNREVKPQFMAYQLETTSGKSITGIVTAETPNSVTIRRLDGTSESVQRSSIDSLRSTGLSFMPEGLEKQIGLQEMADLLAYLNSIK